MQTSTGTNPDLPILFEDNHLLAIQKPIGVLSQEDHTGSADVVNLCKEYLKREYDKPGNVYLGLLHRLDKPVSGVMLLAKTSKSASRLSEQIRKRKVKKTYLVVVDGDAPENGYLSHHLLKNESTNTVSVVPGKTKGAKEALLTFQKIASAGGKSLLKISLITGRAHQIRVQLAEHGYPIIGDHKYGSDKQPDIALHAHEFIFEHPTLKNEIIISSYPRLTPPWSLFKDNISH